MKLQRDIYSECNFISKIAKYDKSIDSLHLEEKGFLSVNLLIIKC